MTSQAVAGRHMSRGHQDQLQAEAGAVGADLRLDELLARVGQPVRVGASALGLMVRRDVDITVTCPALDAATLAAVAGIGAELFPDDSPWWWGSRGSSSTGCGFDRRKSSPRAYACPVIGKQLMAAGGALIIGALGAAGCASSPGPAPPAAVRYGSPEQATLSWFYAINHQYGPAAVAHFTRAAAGLMDWGGGDTSTWGTFSALRCRPASMQGPAAATVYCSFSESVSASEGNPDTWWAVYLQRLHDGRWLIDSYGQG